MACDCGQDHELGEHGYYPFYKGELTDEQAKDLGWDSYKDLYRHVLSSFPSNMLRNLYHIKDEPEHFTDKFIKDWTRKSVLTYTFTSEGGPSYDALGYRVYDREIPVIISPEGTAYMDAEDEELFTRTFC